MDIMDFILFLVDREDFYSIPQYEPKPTRPSFSTLTLRKKGKSVSSWDIKDFYSISVLTVSKLNTDVSRSVEV